jgi:hypothetical protein
VSEEMGRSQKERFETCEVVPIQLASELGAQEDAVGANKARSSSSSSEKRLKGAEKPIYLDRV